MSAVTPQSVGQPVGRIDGEAKVSGFAKYAFEQHVEAPVHLHLLQATIARGRITEVDSTRAEALDGVLLVLTHRDEPELADTSDGEYALLQSAEVAFRGQIVGVVAAASPEIARQAAALVRFSYAQEAHDTALRTDHPDAYAPDQVNPSFPCDTEDTEDTGDTTVDSALAAAAVVVDACYSTPMEHNNPLEPHACTARWDADEQRLTLFDSTQHPHGVQATMAKVFGLQPEQVRVVAPYVGGGFGSKGMPHAHNVLAVLAARALPGRAVKLALTRQQMFALVGYRTPTLQRVQLGADTEGRVVAVSHDALEQTSRIKEFAEQTTVGTRSMYAATARRTSHRLVPLDVAVPSWMRAPGEAPGMFALESAMDELADACGIDPVELRVRNDPETDPETGKPWSSRRLVECLRVGASRFGWSARQAPGARRDGDWLVGLGVASSAYPATVMPGNTASVSYAGHGHYQVCIGSADIGTGNWTVLTQIAADALEQPLDHVHVEIGDSDLPAATVSGGSAGTVSHGSAVVQAAREFLAVHGRDPRSGARVEVTTEGGGGEEGVVAHSYGAQFVEARVNLHTGEVRVPRMTGVFAPGRIINPRTARSQLVGGMVWGLSMALFEHSVVDHRFGHVVTADLADYHVPTHADIGTIDVSWLDDEDLRANALGAKGIGEIGIVGTAAAVASAVHNATGVRMRNLPFTPDRLLTART